jgi:YVTN family beta-propeller protein
MHRLSGLAALLVMLVAAARGEAAPFLYLVTATDPSQIEVIDVASDAVVARLPGFANAHGLAATTDGARIVVGSLDERTPGATIAKPAGVSAADHAAHHGGGAATPTGPALSVLTVLDGASGEVLRRIDVPGSVHHVAVSPNGRFAAATHPGGASVSVVDLNSGAVLATIPVGDNPNYAVFTPDGAALAVSVAGQDVIALIDTGEWQVAGRIAVGGSPEHIVQSPDGSRLYVNNVDDGSVSEIDMTTRKQVRTIALDGAPLHGLDLTDDGGALIVSILGDDAVARIDLASGAVTRAALAPAPYHVAAAHGSGKVYVSSAAEPGLSVLSQHDLSEIGRVEIGGVGHQAVSLAVSPLVGGEVQ